MSTPCPYRIIKGDDGLSVKVEWDVHYLTDEQIGMVRKHVADTEAENAKLRELVRDMFDGMCGYEHDCRSCEHYELHEGQRFVGECEYHKRMRELGVEV